MKMSNGIIIILVLATVLGLGYLAVKYKLTELFISSTQETVKTVVDVAGTAADVVD